MRNLRFVLLLAVLLLAGCADGSDDADAKPLPDRPALSGDQLQAALPAEGDTIAVFSTTAGEIRAILYEEESPIAVENFVTLAQRGYYDGTVFFRSVYDFVVQGGDGTNNDGTGSETAWSGSGFDLEYSSALHHYAGALCAAFAPQDPDSGASQFYFVTALPGGVEESLLEQMTAAGWDAGVVETYRQAGGLPYLDNTDTVFGQVYSGWEALDAIACAETDENDRPVEDIVLESVRIETYAES